MKDHRIRKVAHLLVRYSTKVKKEENVYISCYEPEAIPLAEEVYREVLAAGAFPSVHIESRIFDYYLMTEGNEAQRDRFPKWHFEELKDCQVFIGIGSYTNGRLFSNVDFERISRRQKVVEPVQEFRVNRMRWVVTRYPTPTMAHDAEMATSEYEEFFFSAVLQDWRKQHKVQNKLRSVLDGAAKVHITGPGTDLVLSLRGRKGIKCCGDRNIPDGELYYAPVEDSAEGHILFDYPGIKDGVEIPNIRLEFRKGEAVGFESSARMDKLEKILATDEGARRIGELGIGTNYGIDRFTKSLLFDEKIGGTVHLALGRAYEDSGGANRSAIHWDIVKDLRRGGRIMVDGVILQENGKFILE
jgi:aminopeptidase